MHDAPGENREPQRGALSKFLSAKRARRRRHLPALRCSGAFKIQLRGGAEKFTRRSQSRAKAAGACGAGATLASGQGPGIPRCLMPPFPQVVAGVPGGDTLAACAPSPRERGKLRGARSLAVDSAMAPEPDRTAAQRSAEPGKQEHGGGGVGCPAELAPEERAARGVGREAAHALRRERDERDRRESPDARAPRRFRR